MKAQIVEQVELFSEAELESLEFVPEELEAIEEERVPDLDSISFEEITEALEAALETNGLPSNFFRLPPELAYRVFRYLSPRDLARLKQTSRKMHDLVKAFEEHNFNAFVARFSRLRI
jgi:hypothetical protein